MSWKNRPDAPYWERHPILSSLVFLAAGVCWLSAAIATLVAGQFYWVHRGRTEFVTQIDSPIRFWGAEVFSFLVSGGSIAAGVLIFKLYRRRQ